ncbi:putative membrane protein SirB2 [Nitrosomonas communis]|uniref:Invasion gene expression up-regulator SirB n=2 Tax=Nitrosomonadaceae TaxID=206379 RepID=A0A0F7KFS5_9PROT|nr:SirB2 family protein [Nitrosomonas communis]AKH39320.1 Invasion gene expression up-regulator SirB [Nitrosomonas communis]TYP80628.1 putative membrane protein SirB2 [Nitrosomonas communis]UVS61544.1 SirB2 family protein [Nitrosomonas sp. PLL12]
MSYTVLKFIHISSVILSYLLFLTRGIWMIHSSAQLQQRWVKIMPHVIDTVLLTSAITLTVLIQQYPLADAWLTAKVAGLLLYIGLGITAFRFGKTYPIKVGAWIMAQIVFFYIVLVALTKNPAIFL